MPGINTTTPIEDEESARRWSTNLLDRLTELILDGIAVFFVLADLFCVLTLIGLPFIAVYYLVSTSLEGPGEALEALAEGAAGIAVAFVFRRFLLEQVVIMIEWIGHDVLKLVDRIKRTRG